MTDRTELTAGVVRRTDTYAAGDAWIDTGYVHKADSEEGRSPP